MNPKDSFPLQAAYRAGCQQAFTTFKLAEWNWELTGRPQKKDAISSDNGKRAYGNQFNAPGNQNRSVGQAFNSLDSTRPSDFLNEMGQGLIGAAP